MRIMVGLALLVFVAGCSGESKNDGNQPVDVVVDVNTVDETSVDVSEVEEDTQTPDIAEIDQHTEPVGPWCVPVGDEDKTFKVGPYLGHTTSNSVAISWETEEPGSTLVEFGPDEGYGRQVEGDPGTLHQVVIGGLTSETVYHYRVCTDDVCSADLTFATACSPGRLFDFTVYGDTRSDPTMHRNIVDNMVMDSPAFVVNTGDVVNDGDQRPEFAEYHFEPLRQLGQYLPAYVAIGNHGWRGEDVGEADIFRDYFMFPKDPDVPIKELSYTFTYGDVFFLIMDNTLDGFQFFHPIGAPPGPPLWVWLNEQVSSPEAQNAKWRFAAFHYPPGSPCQEDWGMINATRDYVIPLLNEFGFHGVFAGHVHSYERHDYDGLPVFVTGGGGAGLKNEDECVYESETLQVRKIFHHHMKVSLKEDQALVEAVGADGEVFDSLVLDADSNPE